MNRNRLIVFLLGGLTIGILTACGIQNSNQNIAESTQAVTTSAQAEQTETRSDRVFSYHFADKDEAVRLYLSNNEYFEKVTAYDLQYKAQDINATVDTLKAFGAEQMRSFTEDEKDAINAGMNEIEALLKKKHIHLPKTDEISFIRSTQAEEGSLGIAYTHGTQIYMDGTIPEFLGSSQASKHEEGIRIVLHEIFHCLTRNNPDFRREMYQLIGFEIADSDYEIPEAVASIALSNPDVEHHDASATFTINGEPMECYLVLIAAKPFEKAGDLPAGVTDVAFVPVNKDNLADGRDYYTFADAVDFFDVVGKNTNYVIDPEECMADNFSYAITGRTSYSADFPTPAIIDGILNIVQEDAA